MSPGLRAPSPRPTPRPQNGTTGSGSCAIACRPLRTSPCSSTSPMTNAPVSLSRPTCSALRHHAVLREPDDRQRADCPVRMQVVPTPRGPHQPRRIRRSARRRRAVADRRRRAQVPRSRALARARLLRGLLPPLQSTSHGRSRRRRHQQARARSRARLHSQDARDQGRHHLGRRSTLDRQARVDCRRRAIEHVKITGSPARACPCCCRCAYRRRALRAAQKRFHPAHIDTTPITPRDHARRESRL